MIPLHITKPLLMSRGAQIMAQKWNPITHCPHPPVLAEAFPEPQAQPTGLQPCLV